MILEEQTKDMVIVGEDTSKKATISADKMAKLQYLLTKGLYKDPITAVIAEWTNNGVDSVVQSGKNPIDNPVLVTIGKNEKGQYALTVEDNGCGLDNNDFENICMNYLESTKETSNDTIGHFGKINLCRLGEQSPRLNWKNFWKSKLNFVYLYPKHK